MDIEIEQIMTDISNACGMESITYYEQMTLAVQIQRNRILKQAFVIVNDKTPTALEAIVIELKDLASKD